MSGTTSRPVMGTPRHRIPVADLDAVAAGRVTGKTAARLFRIERSRRMLMLRGVTAALVAAGDPGPLPPATEAVELLLRAEAADGRVVSELLAHPAVGVWAVGLLTRLRSKEAADAPGRPLWQDAGYLHALAGAAAVRAGVSAVVRVPARNGTVCLPTLGRAEFPGPHVEYATAVLDTSTPGAGETATLTLGTRVLRLSEEPGRPGERWHPVRTLVWCPGGRAHSPVLDDSDPYRDFRDPHPVREPLTAAEEDRWRRLLAEAGQVLAARHPDAGELLSSFLRTLAPLPRMPRFRAASASYSEAVGGVLASEPYDATELAATLVHEARHSVLNSLAHQVGLFRRPDPKDPEEPLLYAPWRSDPRPTSGLVHGAFAFAGVADFWRVERHALHGHRADLAHFEFAVWRDAVAQALRSLSAPEPQACLTDWGCRFVARLASWTAPWAREQVPPRPLATARAEGVDLRVTWRLHHLRADPGAVRELAERWRAGQPPRGVDVPVELGRPGAAGGREPRSELRRVLLADGEPAGGIDGVDRPADLLAADLSLVAGDTADALRGYRTVLADDPGAHAAWAGLALALAAADATAATPSLLGRPELVRALALELHGDGASPVDPVKLCTWLSE